MPTTCSHCGQPTTPDALACGSCGTSLGSGAVALPLEVLTFGGLTTLALTRAVTVGRAGANVLVDHPDLAPIHCRVEPDRDHWRVRNLSDRGLFSGGALVDVVELRAGELVDLGGTPGAAALALPCALGDPLPLRLRLPGQPDAHLQLLKLPMLIGRASWADLPLADPNVSNVHARLRIDAGRIVVDDLHSRNGTFVNQERLSGPRELRHGDRLRFGATELVFGREEAPPVAAPSRPVDAEPEPSVIVEATLPQEGPFLAPGLTIEQLSAPPDQHVHVPRDRRVVTEELRVDADSCPACGNSFFLQRAGVVAGVVRIARTAVRVVGRRDQRGHVGRCSSCGARLATCPECECASAAPSLLEKVVCRRCGEGFLPG